MPRDYFYELSTQQAEIGHDVNVITWNRNGEHLEVLDDDFTTHRLPGPNLSLFGAVQEYPYLPSLPTADSIIAATAIQKASDFVLTDDVLSRDLNYRFGLVLDKKQEPDSFRALRILLRKNGMFVPL